MAYTIITCSGISNTGKLTTQTGRALLHRCGREVEACISATRPTVVVEEAIGHAERILILDGCADCCARKRLRALGVEPQVHLIATDCGIEKNGMTEPRFDEIERLAVAVMEAIRR